MKDVYNQLEGMVCFDFVKKEDEISIENIQYTSTFSSQHSIVKDQSNIIK